MDLGSDGEVNKLGQTPGFISSLNEAWFNTLDRCVIDTTLSEAIFPSMHACFFGGAIHAVLLLQKGHGNQLASDIAGFVNERAAVVTS